MSANITSLAKQTYTRWSDHEAPRLGASVAFYSILSFAPLLILVTAVIALVFGHESAQRALVGEAQQVIGEHGAETVNSLLKNAQKPATGAFASIVAFVTLLFGASGVFTELQDALNIMWDVKKPAASGVAGMVRQRLFSFGMVLSIGFLLLVTLLLSAGLAALGHSFSEVLPLPEPVLHIFNFLVSFVVVAVLFALMFKYVPAAKVSWRGVIVGAIGTAVLFTIGKLLLAIYIGKAGVGSTYGAAGSLVAVVVWIYYSAQIFFFGAEFTHVYAEAHALHAAGVTHAPAPLPQSAPKPLQSADAQPAAQPASPIPNPAALAAAPVPQKAMAAAVGSTAPSYLSVPAAIDIAETRTARATITQTVLASPQQTVQRPLREVLIHKPNQTKPRLLMALGLGMIIGRVLAGRRELQRVR